MATQTKPEPGTGIATDGQREIAVSDLPAVIRTSDSARTRLASFLPEGVSLDRVAASLDLALRRDRAAWAEACKKDRTKNGPPPLERCDPASVLLAVAQIIQMGLEIGRTAHLVPFGTQCTPIADYKGLEELMYASGVARLIQPGIVYENELKEERFRLTIGTPTTVEHHPIVHSAQRGEMVGAYVIVHLRGGHIYVEYMTLKEVEAVRQGFSKQWKLGPMPPWYMLKTVLRRSAKHIPQNPRLAKALAVLDAGERVLDVPEELARTMVRAAAENGDGDAMPHTHRLGGPRPISNQGEDGYGPGITTPLAAPAPAALAPAGERALEDEFIDDRDIARADAARAAAAQGERPQHQNGGPACPTCGGEMWDNRTSKRNPKAPDFKCKARDCEGVLWPPKAGAAS